MVWDCLVVCRFILCTSSVEDEKAGILCLFFVCCYCQRTLSVPTLWNTQSLKYYWFSLAWLPHAFLCLFFWLLLAFSSSLHYTFPFLSTVFHLIFFFSDHFCWKLANHFSLTTGDSLLGWGQPDFPFHEDGRRKRELILSSPQKSCVNNVFNLR